MLPSSIRLPTLAILCLIAQAGLAQDTTRNITFPSSTASAVASTSTSTAGATTNMTTTPTANNNNTTPTSTNGTVSTNATLSNNATRTSTTTATTPLASISDSTGSGSVPVPAPMGGKPNGRYGPDDQYIAGVGRLAVPVGSVISLLVVSLYLVY